MNRKIVNWAVIDREGQIEKEDDPQITEMRSRIIREKGFLRKLYADNYRIFEKVYRELGHGKYVELGSGGGFIKEIIPDVITSDILPVTTVDMSFDALHMPFEDNSIDAFFMVYAFHHMKDVKRFFQEIHRCLRKGGRIVMIEPTNNLWGGFVFRHIHYEHYDPMAEWEMEGTAPLSSSNAALPWIIFKRDRSRFEREVSYLKVRSIRYHTPVRYLISGGVTAPQFLPTFMYEFVRFVEFLLSPLNSWIGMFSTIELEK